MKKFKSKMNWFYLFMGIICLFAAQTEIQAQINQFVACQDKQMWLVNESQVALIGKCDNKNWIAPVKVETAQSANKKPNKIEKQVAAALEKTSKEQFKPVSISEINLNQTVQNESNQTVIVLDSSKLQPFIKNFLLPSMEIIVVRGPGSAGNILEKERFTIKLFSANPTIKEMLDEVRKVYSDQEDVKEYGEFYILEDYTTTKKLDENKTAADYNLKNGDKVLLSYDYARYKNLKPGVRGGTTQDNEKEAEMEFIIVIGSGVIDDSGKITDWNESSRYKVIIKKENPTIAEILEQAKVGIPESEYLKNIKDYLYLRLFNTNDKLDNNKTIADYKLTSGTVFRLQSSVR